MNKKTKERQALALDIMTLGFFARHFNFPLKDLQWGIVEIKTKDALEVVCAVLMKSNPLLYIDIADCKIRPCVNTSNVSFVLNPCEIQEEPNKLVFFFEEIAIGLDKEKIAGLYADKVYSADTIKYLLGGFWDLC